MAIYLNNIKTALQEPAEKALETARKKLGVPQNRIVRAYLVKTSIDARKRSNLHFVHTVGIELDGGEAQLVDALHDPSITLRQESPLEIPRGSQKFAGRPVIVGFGPAGMFSALLLAEQGYRPLVVERGADVDARAMAVDAFWQDGRLDTHTNVQFGEGGAGTFSDGKLTTRIGDPRCGYVLKTLHRFGAPAEILQRAKPHIGTDHLRRIVKNIRCEIERLGGTVQFFSQCTDLQVQNGQVQGILVNGSPLATENVLFAIGHSARDTFEMLASKGIVLQAKAFSVGARIEHLQSEIDKGLYGPLAGHPALPAGEYQLSLRENGRAVYTFCMCPGGFVVPSSSEENTVVTNGMSEYLRDQPNANAALVVSVGPEDFGNGPLDGMAFQRRLERAAFEAGGGGYRAPAQTVGSFLQGKPELRFGRVQPSYACGVTPSDLGSLLPAYVTDMLRRGLSAFGRKLPGYDSTDAVLTGLETRTSSPVRITRSEDFEALGIRGLYPCGEGAGYAGGIVSAAVDGVRAAQALMRKYRPF